MFMICSFDLTPTRSRTNASVTPARIIENYRTALLRLVGFWFASVGLASDRNVTVVKRHVFWRVTRLLRSAEAALRRLIFVEARGITVNVSEKRAAPTGQIPRGDGGI